MADSDESVESDEDFFFVDDRKRDTKRTSPEKKNSIINTGKFKVTLKKPGERGVKSESTKSEPRLGISDVDSIKVNDFAVIMEAFDGFSSPAKDESLSAENVKDRKKVKSFKNRLFAATYPEDSKEDESGPEIAMVPLPGNPDLSDTNIPPGQDTSWEENSLADDNNDKPDKSTRTDEMIEGNVVSSEKHPVLDEETIPRAQPTEDSETADSVVSGENTKSEKGTSLECDESSVAKGSNAQNSKLNLVNGDTLCGQIPSSSEVQMAGIDEIPENGDFPTDVEPIYVNLPRNNVSKVSDDSPEKLSRENEVEKTALVDDNGQQSASTPESSVEPTEPCKTPTPNENRVENEDGKTSPVSPVPGKSPQELYTVVLPNEQEPGPDAVKPKATKDQVETGPESLVEPSTKSSPRCLSYLVISAGEGHVDLRMKLKSKNEIKKDMQTRLLIWRVNGKA